MYKLWGETHARDTDRNGDGQTDSNASGNSYGSLFVVLRGEQGRVLKSSVSC